jgi:hypothetical protein
MPEENKVRFKSKTPVDNLSSRCCWCYEIELKWEHRTVALDVPENLPAFDPDGYTECNDYAIILRTETSRGIPEGKKMISTGVEAGSRTVRICFISTCAESAQDQPVSLHFNDEDGWHELAAVAGTVPLPAMARSLAPDRELIELLAFYEGAKLSHLLSRTTVLGPRGEA